MHLPRKEPARHPSGLQPSAFCNLLCSSCFRGGGSEPSTRLKQARTESLFGGSKSIHPLRKAFVAASVLMLPGAFASSQQSEQQVPQVLAYQTYGLLRSPRKITSVANDNYLLSSLPLQAASSKLRYTNLTWFPPLDQSPPGLFTGRWAWMGPPQLGF